MAVAHDAASESHTGATGSINEASFSWSHNPVGTPRGVLVFVVNVSGITFSSTAVTYDGAALSKINAAQAVDSAGEPGFVDVYFLGSGVPTTDPATIIVTRDNGAEEMWAVGITVTAAGDTELYTTSIAKLEGDGTLAEQSVDDGSPGTNSLRYAGGFSGLAAPPGPGANSTAVHDFDTGQQTAAVVRETTAGQGSRSVGFSAASDDRAVTHFAIRETGGGTISPGALALVITAEAPARLDQEFTPGAIAVAVIAEAPSVEPNVNPDAIAITLTIVAPDRIDQDASPSAVALAIIPEAPTSLDQETLPGSVGLSLAVEAPELLPAIDAPAIALTVAVLEPPSIDQDTSPTAVALTVAPEAPTISGAADQQVEPGAIALSLSPEAPLRLDLEVTPAEIGLILTPVAPVQLDQDATLAAIALTLGTPEPILSLDGALTIAPDAVALLLGAESPALTLETQPGPIDLALALGVPALEFGLLPPAIALTIDVPAPVRIDVELLAEAIGIALAAAVPGLELVIGPDALALNLGVEAPTLTLAIVTSSGSVRMISVPIRMGTGLTSLRSEPNSRSN